MFARSLHSRGRLLRLRYIGWMVHLMEVVIPGAGQTKAEGQCWSHCSLAIGFSLSHIGDQLISDLLNGRKRYLRSCYFASLQNLLKRFISNITHYFTMGKIIHRVLDIGVEVYNSDDGVGPTILNVIDVMRNSHFYDLLTRDVLSLLTTRFFVLPSHLLLAV